MELLVLAFFLFLVGVELVFRAQGFCESGVSIHHSKRFTFIVVSMIPYAFAFACPLVDAGSTSMSRRRTVPEREEIQENSKLF